MLLDTSQQAPLLRSPFSRHPVKEVRIYAPVQFVHAHGVNPVLKAGVFAAKLAYRLLTVAGVVGLGLLQGVREPFEHLLIEGQSFEQAAEVFFEDFFSCVGFGASALVPRTMMGARISGKQRKISERSDGTGLDAARVGLENCGELVSETVAAKNMP